MSIDFLSKCRTCLSESSFFHQLFDYVDENYKILEMIDCIAPQIDIKCNTQFSTLICQPCVNKLLMGYKFQQLCIETNIRLLDLLGIAGFETQPKLEKVLDPLTEETNLNMKQEVEDDVCYKQDITANELEMPMRSDNDDDWEPMASSGSDSKEMLRFQCPDCLKCFERKTSLSAHYKVHREKHDSKPLYKARKVDTTTKVDQNETTEIANNTQENEPRVCVKEEYEITPQIIKDNVDESETNGELFNNNSENSDDESDKNLFVKHVKSNKVVDFKDAGVAKTKRPNSSNRKSRIYPCEVCGRVFNRLFNLKRHNYKMHREKHDSKLVYKDNKVETSTKVDKIDTPENENNRKENESIVCVKNNLEITPQILQEPMNKFEENGELFSNDSECSDDKSNKDLFVKQVKSSKAVDFIDTGVAKIKKPNSSNSQRRNSPCEVCGKVFYSVFNLRRHEYKVHKKKHDVIDGDLGEQEIPNGGKRKMRNYSCKVCGKVFDRLFNLKRHSSIHSANDLNTDLIDTDVGEIEKPKSKSRNFPCEVCSKIFSESSYLKRHSSVHSLTRPHACKICKYRFATVNALKCHLSQHKNGTLDNWKTTYSRPEGFKCPDCPRRFEKHASLAGHRRKHTHNNANYPCTVCQSHFTTVRFLTKHIINKHPEVKQYKCDQCEKTFVSHALLVEHLNRHNGNNNLVCLICEEEFSSTNDLTEHMGTHSGYTNSLNDGKILHLCPQCGKTFSKDCLLRWHMERHSELKKYQCPECPSRFTCKAYLKKHALRHTNAKPHACDICGSRFKTVNDVRHHKRWHSSEKPFKCDQCSMTFAISYVLKRHMRTHTGEKPHKCKYCERAFADYADLNKHLRTHVGENTYMCDQCSMAFKYHAELKQHQTEHYKLAQKQAQQMSDEVQHNEINNIRNIQYSTNDTQQQLLMSDSQINEDTSSDKRISP